MLSDVGFGKAGSDSRLVFFATSIPHILVPFRKFVLRPVCASLSLSLIFCCCLFSSVDAQTAPQGAAVLARVGDAFITEQEFLQRFEMLPSAMRRQGRPEETKAALLFSLIAERLLAAEGRDRGLEKDSLFLFRMDGITRMLARDELYRDEVQRAVRVTPEERRAGMRQARRELFLEYAVFQNRIDADFVLAQLRGGRALAQIQIDSSIACLRDTVTVTWGEAEAPIEEAVFRLRKGEHSAVVRASQGYYILELRREGVNQLFANMSVDVLQERVENTIHLRKEQARLDTVIERLLAGKVGHAIPRTFRSVAEAVTAVLTPLFGQARVVVTDSMIAMVQQRIPSILEDTLLVFGDRAWNAARCLEWLANKDFDVSIQGKTVVAAQLNEKFMVLVQQELLADEAIHRGLHERPDVRNQLRMWEDQTLADLCERDLRRSTTVGEAEIVSRLRTDLNPSQIPFVQIRLLTTSNMETARSAWAALANGKTFEDAVSEYSVSAHEKLTGGLLEPMRILDDYPIGWMAWRLEPGKRFGPIPLSQGACIIELVRKDLPQGFDEGAFREKGSSILQDLQKDRQAKAVDAFTARLARDKGYTAYEDRLNALPVTNIPMMTYRILGFGGRMFAAPFVTPRLRWLEQETETPPVP